MPDNDITDAVAAAKDTNPAGRCGPVIRHPHRALGALLASLLLIGVASQPVAAAGKEDAASTVASGVKPIANPDALAFFDTAARSDLAQIRMAQYVVRNARDPGVIFFAKRMLQEHGADLQQLHQLARNKGVKLPTELGTESLQFITRLEKLQSPMLEHEYAAIGGINFHLKEQAAYKKQAEDGEDDTLKTHARDALPKIADHIRMARHLIANTQSE